MRPLDDREQRYAYVGAGMAAFMSLALWVPSFDKRAAVALSGIGMMMATLLAAAAKRRSRVFTGLAAVLLAFGPWGMAWVLGLPFMVLAGWLALKSHRLQAPSQPVVDEHGEIVTKSTGEPPAAAEPRQRWRRRGREAGGDDESPAAVSGPPVTRAAPAPNKRYTPPQRRR